jgi:hypothetical protein
MLPSTGHKRVPEPLAICNEEDILSRAVRRKSVRDSGIILPDGLVIRKGMEIGHCRKDDMWQVVLEMGALSHGLIMLYLGERMDVTPARFRVLYRRSFRRYLCGIRT